SSRRRHTRSKRDWSSDVCSSDLTVTLNGKTYTTSVGANGAWSVQVPTADAQTLGEGNQAVLVSGKDATGNTVTGAQLLTVDTQRSEERRVGKERLSRRGRVAAEN